MSEPPFATPAPYPAYPTRPPMSAAAVAGFVCSVALCIPLVPQLLGGILGIVGLVKTADGRLRGRGLAIAAVIIGPLVGIAWAIILYVGILWSNQTVAATTAVVEAWETDADFQARLTSLYDIWFSPDLKIRLTREELTTFAEAIKAKYGGLQNAETADQPFTIDPVSRDLLVDVGAEFEKGDVPIQVALGRFGMNWFVQNIQIGEKWLVAPQ